MAWADIELYKVNELVNATALDALKENIEYLHLPNITEYQHPGTGSDYTVTTNKAQDIDPVFNLSLTTYGGLVVAVFYGVWDAPGAGVSIRANIVRHDPISYVGRNLFYEWNMEYVKPQPGGKGWIQFFPNLPAGTHEFRAVWGVPSGTGTLLAAFRPYMAVAEI